MNSIRRLSFARAQLIGLVGASLAACGGAGSAADGEGLWRAAHQTPAGAEPTSTLVADDGSAMLSEPTAVPEDRGARTRAGLYASPRQAEHLERALGAKLIHVIVECCGADGVDRALSLAYGMQAAGDLPNHTPVLVRSADLRLGAATANRLSDTGYTHVWLVTQ